MVWCICVNSLELLSQSVKSLCQCGPHTWAEKYHQSGGHRQSPIDIVTKDVVSDPSLWRRPLKWHYPKRTTEVVNTGYCWKAHVPNEPSFLEGGPLQNKYVLEQYHCHWGPDDSVGSEHLINGEAYAAEIHYVHWNTKYGSFNEALKHGDGLAVLGLFLKVGKENAELGKLVKLLSRVEYKGQAASFHEALDPAALLPKRGAYYTYPGSLTTPPCNECVIWIVFQDVIEVSAEQLEAMRSMNSEDQGCCQPNTKIVNNYRPPLPCGERRVKLGYI